MIKEKKRAMTNQSNDLLTDSSSVGKSIEQPSETEDIIDEIDLDMDDRSESSSTTINKSTIGNSHSDRKKRSSLDELANVTKRNRIQ